MRSAYCGSTHFALRTLPHSTAPSVVPLLTVRDCRTPPVTARCRLLARDLVCSCAFGAALVLNCSMVGCIACFASHSYLILLLFAPVILDVHAIPLRVRFVVT
jgi:hypothetical protein